MTHQIRMTLATLCRATRADLDITQRELASAVGITPAYVASIERGRANPSLDLVARIADALGLELEFVARPPNVVARASPGDLVHARCSAYATRRLKALGWQTAREVRIVHGRWHGWIDLLAFNPRTRTLIVIELKTRIDDFGAIERNLRWHEQSALAAALELGWKPRRVFTWLLVLASAEVDDALRLGRDTMRLQFPVRAGSMTRIVAGETLETPSGWGLAMIDPSSRRRDWLIKTRLDGRRTAPPYASYGDAARRFAG